MDEPFRFVPNIHSLQIYLWSGHKRSIVAKHNWKKPSPLTVMPVSLRSFWGIACLLQVKLLPSLLGLVRAWP